MNVLLITIDSLRADHVGCLGCKDTTPVIDKLAKRGLLFTNAISCGPDTPTSIYPLMTSSYVLTYYILKANRRDMKTSVDEFELMRHVILDIYRYENTIAGVLRKHGYKTAAFHSNPYLSRYYNFGRDFDYFYDSISLKSYSLKQRIKKIVERFSFLYDIAWFLYKNIYSKIVSTTADKVPYERAGEINRKVERWLKNVRDEMFFLWVHYMDVHFPYIPPEEFRSVDLDVFSIVELNNKMLKDPEKLTDEDIETLLTLYDDAIRFVDHEIGRLIDLMDDLGLLEDTIVIITSDHGDEFGDHGDFAHHHSKLYDENIWVPLIMYNVGFKGRIDETISLIDIAPTIMDLLSLPKPKTFQGKSLLSVISGESRGGVFSESLQRMKRNIALRTNDWKFILDSYRNRRELYDLRKDPKERENVYDEHRDIAKKMEERILNHILRQKRRITEKIAVRKKIQKIKGKF